MRFFNLLFVLLHCTCVRAQLRPDPPAFIFLADQLPEMFVTTGIPNGDYGPTRLALSRHLMLWQSAHLGASWSLQNMNHTGLGGFSPHFLWQPRRNRVGTAFAGSADRYALRASTNPLNRGDRLNASFSLLQDRALRDTDEDQRNDFPARQSLYGNIASSWGDYDYRGNISLTYYTDEDHWQARFRTQNRRISLQQEQRWTSNRVLFFTKANATAEYLSRAFEDRFTDGRRLTGALIAGIMDNRGGTPISWEAILEALHREDQLDAPGTILRQKEQFVAVNGHFSWDVAPFRLRFNQQLRSSKMDGLVYRPHLQATWFSYNDKIKVAALLNRGGGYRNPLLSE
ncbi:MAG: hypothetical protein AAF597_20235, partial [Bacteroidota bacterium]